MIETQYDYFFTQNNELSIFFLKIQENQFSERKKIQLCLIFLF